MTILADHQSERSQFQDLWQVLPALSRHQVQRLLREMKEEGKIVIWGRTKAARWYPAKAHSGIAASSKL